MGLFNKNIAYNSIIGQLDSLSVHIMKLVPLISKDIQQNIILNAKQRYGIVSTFNPNMDDTYLYAYSIITIGSYLNGKKLMKGQEWINTVNHVNTFLSKKLGKNSFDPQIKYINQFEYNRLNQALQVIKELIDSNSAFKNIPIEYQVSLFNYMVPLIELMSLYIAIYIDFIMDKNNIPKQRELLFEYERTAEVSYKINLENYHELLRFI